ncbi:MAG: patatin-like phospholipase family protein [Pseudomonadota bacterium]
MALSLAGCVSLTRTPITEQDIDRGAPYGVPNIRAWGDSINPAAAQAILAAEIQRTGRMHGPQIAKGGPIRETILTLSGGGADGAFGAGLLAGWTERGDRPNFDVVTGVSTGAIVGLFAFLGPKYDPQLRKFYTHYDTSELLEPALFSALRGAPSISDASGYNGLIDQYINDDVVAELAEEAAKGRVLLVGTTNLDAARPVIWDLTAIASSGHPNAGKLVRSVVRASSAVPAVFPPVVIPTVTAAGQSVDELHVDGGATAQVMLFSPELPLSEVDAAIGVKIDRTLYAIINNSLRKPYQPVDLGVLSIAGRAASSLISGSGGGDLYKIFAITERDGVDFNAVWIPETFVLEPSEAFDPAYMEALYEFGYQYGLDGDKWRNAPPNFVSN